MKKGFMSLALIIFLFSCNTDDDNNSSDTELIGTWKLTENYADPGDGSGDFEIVDSDKTIEFFTDGSITSNGSLCNMSIEATTPSSGTYTNTESVIYSTDCDFILDFNVSFSLNDAILTISYPCIEPCISKYEKVQ